MSRMFVEDQIKNITDEKPEKESVGDSYADMPMLIHWNKSELNKCLGEQVR